MLLTIIAGIFAVLGVGIVVACLLLCALAGLAKCLLPENKDR